MNKKILVTGGCGFIGSHLVEKLVVNNYSVIVFDKYNNNNSYGWLDESPLKKDIEFKLGDIRDLDYVKQSTLDCDVILHLAALIGIPYSYSSPLGYIKTNVEGTYNILQSAREMPNLSNLVITSTSEVYGSAQTLPMSENHPLVAQSPYSATKISADALSISYNKSFETPLNIIRPFNTYGPRQSNRAIIPTIISQLYNTKNEYIELGNISTYRDFNYVDDITDAFIAMFEELKTFGDVYNISSGDSYSINEIANKIFKISGIKKDIKNHDIRIRPPKSEVNKLQGDSNKFKKLTNWSSKINIDEGIAKTIEWIKSSKTNKSNSSSYIV